MQDNRIPEFSGQPRTYWSKLCYNYKYQPPPPLKLIENCMIYCWNLAGNYYARINSAYVLTFEVVENSKKVA